MAKMQPIPGIDMPDFYWVLDDPAPLAGMCLPYTSDPWRAMHQFGFRWIISLQPGEYNPFPLKVGFACHLEDLVHGRPPKNAKREIDLISQATRFAVGAMEKGEGVIVHCMGGRGRTGTVLGCILRHLGCATKDIVEYLDSLHKARGRKGWPESQWQIAAIENYGKGQQHELGEQN